MRFAPRKAYATVLAMLMIVLGTALSVWLYTMVQNAVAIARNEQTATRTQMVSESGLAYMQLKLRQACEATPIDIITDDSAMLVSVGNALASELPGGRVTVMQSIPPVVYVASSEVRGGTFTAEVALSRVHARGFTLSVTGTSGSFSSTIGVEYLLGDADSAAWMNYPMLSRGEMSLGGTSGAAVKIHHWNSETQKADPEIGKSYAVADGFVMDFGDSTPPTSLKFPSKYLSDAMYAKLESMKGSSLAAFRPTTDKKGKAAPAGSLSNRYIPPNTSISFQDGAVLTGIIYVGYPSNLTFNQNITINGVIVYERPAEGEVGAKSVITLDRTINLRSNPEAMAAAVTSALLSSGESGESAQAYAKLLAPWTIHAADTDLDMVEGSTNSLDLWGSMHVRNFLKSAGSGSRDADKYRIHGTVLCEGAVDIRGNRTFSMNPQSENPGDDLTERLALLVRPGGYWEH